MSSLQSTLFGRGPRLGPETDVAELRRQFVAGFGRFGPVPSGAAFTPAQLGPIKGEWVQADNASPSRVILYFHGGGFISGSPETHRPIAARLCAAGQAIGFSVSYRLAPDYAFPAGLRDAVDAYRALLQKGVEPGSIVLAGDDAGGGLAFAALLAIRNGQMPMPAACVALSPWVDLTLSGWSVLTNAKTDTTLSWELLFLTARHYLRKQSPADPYASPIYANFNDFPPLMVHAGSLEILKDDASRIGDKAAEAGVPVSVEIYDGMRHIFQANPDGQESRASLQRLGQFMRQRAGRSMASAAQ